MRKKKLIAGIVAGVAGIVLILWASGYLGLWFSGITYIAADDENFSRHAEPIDGEFTIRINLSDLESNEGEVLYDDGEHLVHIDEVFVQNETNYQVSFRTLGNYSLLGATLVSGVEHRDGPMGFNRIYQATGRATYRGMTYSLTPSGTTGLNYRDGGSFGFYLFPLDREIVIDLETDAFIDVTISNLYMNSWTKN